MRFPIWYAVNMQIINKTNLIYNLFTGKKNGKMNLN